MIDFRLESGKIVFTNGLLQYVDGAERVRQQIEFRLSLWRGEWFLDSEFGTPYLQEILGKQLTINGAISAIQQQITSVDGVTGLVEFSYKFDRENRTLSVEFTAATDYGLIQYP
ncbi:DUF2634 domain-containing protein [Serratia proteamaculans]|uniref:DUF2634 domain-containing protein n=1 Tax=Serratia proteamaculans TaxID=28151 RepID=UPI00101FE2D9|nr:DUF2634 domain-containing protein [Serratia proteamaculans]RYM52008.1 hypothetical protein BSQ97_14840 [Serratia proteamaculans]